MPDITINRNMGNAASRVAYVQGSGSYANSREEIFAMLCESADGLTSKEIAGRLDRPIHAISGRLSELKRDGKIRGNSVMRDGAKVLVVVRAVRQLELLEVA